jgi:hypothetical protein
LVVLVNPKGTKLPIFVRKTRVVSSVPTKTTGIEVQKTFDTEKKNELTDL